MAIAAAWAISNKSVSTSAAIYTVSSTGYKRDLVVTNGGPSTLYVACGAAATVATTDGSFVIPTGGSVILTESQVPVSSIIYGVSAGTSSTFVGFGSNVSYT